MSELVIPKRRNMVHLSKMKDYDFVYWLIERAPDMWMPRVHQKLDGFLFRFGRDFNGDFIYATARSGVLRDPMSVVWYSLDKGYKGEAHKRSMLIGEMTQQIKSSNIMNGIEPGTYIECEVFNKHLAYEEDEMITFVTLPYYKTAFPKDLTIYVHAIRDLKTGDEVDGIITSSDIDVRSSRLQVKDHFNISDVRVYAQQFSTQEIMSLVSLKHRDRATKLQVKNELLMLKQHLGDTLINSKSILQHPIAPTHEGIVIHIEDTPYKVINTKYWNLRNAM